MLMSLKMLKATEQMNKDPICSLLGLAARGRNAVSGEFSVENALKSGKAYVVIIANDASENTRKKFTDMATYRGVPVYLYQDKDILGKCLGKEMRSTVAIVDEGLAKAVIRKFGELEVDPNA